MKTFYLGYGFDEDFLTEYKTPEEADFNAEEWVTVKAKNLEEAKEKYEENFQNWKKLNC
jgi:hypothetical protein